MENVITRRYARAYYELAQEKNLQVVFDQDSAFLRKTFRENPELTQLLTAPEIPAQQKEISVKRIFGSTCSPDTIGLLRLLIRKGRIAYLDGILRQYDQLAKDARGEVTAEVRSAVALSAEQRQRLQKTLEKKLGKTVELKMTVDASLIGGLVVRLGDQLYDNSIRSRMEKLQIHLQQIHLGDAEKVG